MYENTLLNNLCLSIYEHTGINKFTEHDDNSIFSEFLPDTMKKHAKTVCHLKKFNLFGKNSLPIAKYGKNSLPNNPLGKNWQSSAKYGKNNNIQYSSSNSSSGSNSSKVEGGHNDRLA